MKHGIYHTKAGYEVWKERECIGRKEYLTTAMELAARNNLPLKVRTE
jgi:hypothetical protein